MRTDDVLTNVAKTQSHVKNEVPFYGGRTRTSSAKNADSTAAPSADAASPYYVDIAVWQMQITRQLSIFTACPLN